MDDDEVEDSVHEDQVVLADLDEGHLVEEDEAVADKIILSPFIKGRSRRQRDFSEK
ncbi:hypothetical protein KKG31_06995 [Patescibacteria group bacterium]|nr:hypothetical protein [Patescibacteria group bacterium]MBU1758832.1 hypothetical protein [Patescibacteria group bacterium]